MVSGFDQALTTQQLPVGIGLGNSTNFEDLNGSFTMNNGVATIAAYQLTSGNLLMQGDGQIDLGNQYLDIGFRPKLQGGSNLAGVGIPLRFAGKFGQAKAGLDSGALKELATARARDLAAKELRERVGGSLGNTLGGFIGGNNTQGSSESSGIGGLGGLIGGGTSSGSQPQSGTAPSTRDSLGNALGGLFGGSSCLLYTSPSPRDKRQSRMPSSA